MEEGYRENNRKWYRGCRGRCRRERGGRYGIRRRNVIWRGTWRNIWRGYIEGDERRTWRNIEDVEKDRKNVVLVKYFIEIK